MNDPASVKSRGESPRRTFWIAIAIGVVTVGSLGSFFGANSFGQSNFEHARQNLRTSSVEIASALNLAIQHEQDLAISAGAFIIEDSDASETNFIDWAG